MSAAACQRVGDGATVSSADTPQPIDVAQLGHQGVGPVSVAMRQSGGAGAVTDGAQPGFVTQTTFVRHVASEAKDFVPDGRGRRQPNWVATLYRGEQVSILEHAFAPGAGRDARAPLAPDHADVHAPAGVEPTRPPDAAWLHVRTSDAKAGWVKEPSVLAATGLSMATVTAQARVFGRPDLLALNGSRTVAPGTLLFVLRSKEQFSEVNLAGSTTGWVLSDVLVTDDREVDAAKLIDRARLLQEKKDAAAQGVLELVRAHFGNTRLVQALLPPAVAGTPGVLALPPAAPEPLPPATLGAPGVTAPAAPDGAATASTDQHARDEAPAGGGEAAPPPPEMRPSY